ncbi:MAG: hypothetical protein RMJ36_01115 [Candidatus Calescibacterium sp.]|nr:hypothetical protein [Candidatus Calescibacterium sp.]MDW8132240.1 hypothetical protein [Candidatus Calescibacterium sp.]
MFTKGYILYLWLALFTVFVSIFSLILFEYVGSDIKVVRKIYMETRKYFIDQ